MDAPACVADLTLTERAFMDRAFELSLKGWGWVAPNPMVGCVLARRNEIVGEGYHAEFGGPHAEAAALSEAGARAQGAHAFVTLEPCSHAGKTPPCARALVRAGVERVVFGASDPGPGAGGARWLVSRGVEVVGPTWSNGRARFHNPAFFHAHSQAGSELPYLAAKLAISLDARIAGGAGLRTRITGSEAEAETHRMRSGFDGIVVGSTTMLVDDPSLTVRFAAPGRRAPARVVIDSRARTPPDARMIRDGEAPVHVFAADGAPPGRVRRLRSAGVQVHLVGADASKVDLRRALERCKTIGLNTLLCEGGGVLTSALTAAGLVRHIHLFSAPKLLGLNGIAAFPSEAVATWRPVSPPRRLGDDVLQSFEIAETPT